MTVRHILLKYPIWRVIREEKLTDFRKDIKRIFNTSLEATAAICLILKTKLLNQFKIIVYESYTESRGSVDEKRKRFEGRSSDVRVL
jgi:hypothetical protein